MPTKKQTLKAKLKSWQRIAAVVSSIAVITGGVGVFAYQQHTQGQISAAAAAETAIELGQQRIGEVSRALDDLELSIQNAEEMATQAVGQTLDEKELEALLAEIKTAKEIWVEETTRLLELEADVKALKEKAESTSSSVSSLASLVKPVNDATFSNWDRIVIQVSSLGEKMLLVKAAQSVWKQAQEKIVAEKAAAEEAEAAERLARARTITPVSTLTDSGGSTAPSAPAPPAQEVVIPQGQDAELSLIHI